MVAPWANFARMASPAAFELPEEAAEGRFFFARAEDPIECDY